MFAYGGIEVVGGLVDKTENPEKTFTKGVTISAIVITIGYAVGIFLIGVFTNWNFLTGQDNVHIGNFSYMCMKNFGYQLALSFNASEQLALKVGQYTSQYMGTSIFLCLTGAFFTIIYSPLKQLIEGTPKELWPRSIGKIEDGMPKNAMWLQCIIVVLFIIGVTFGGDKAEAFFLKLTLMTNVAMTIPYLLIALAFPKFKNNEKIKKSFSIFKTDFSIKFATFSTVALVGFANVATIIEPAITKRKYGDSCWMIFGPLFFTLVALSLYKRYENSKV